MKTSKEIDQILIKNWSKSTSELENLTGIKKTAIYARARRLKLPSKKGGIKAMSVDDEKRKRQETILRELQNNKIKLLLSENARLEKELGAQNSLRAITTYQIPVYAPSGNNEATAVILASDFHIGETIKRSEVNRLNEFNPTIAKKRVEEFFQNSLRVIDVLGKDIPIKSAVLYLLGDFINNMLFEEAQEENSLAPMREAMFVQNMLCSGIEYYLKNSSLDLTIVCHSGNHARVTKKPRNAGESGHSLEYYMYHSIANHFSKEKRIKFVIPESYLSYVKVYDYTICAHHGHNVRYYGGVGSLAIPMFKAVAQWEKIKRADLYVCGHFHQVFDGGSFIVNGSLVGWNAYAISIKASFEKPKQIMFLVDKKRGRTITAPILFSC